MVTTVPLSFPYPEGRTTSAAGSGPPRGPLGVELVGQVAARRTRATEASPSLPWCQVTLEEGPGLPLTSCVTLGQLLTLSEGQCLIHKTGQVMPNRERVQEARVHSPPLSSMICAHGDRDFPQRAGPHTRQSSLVDPTAVREVCALTAQRRKKRKLREGKSLVQDHTAGGGAELGFGSYSVDPFVAVTVPSLATAQGSAVTGSGPFSMSRAESGGSSGPPPPHTPQLTLRLLSLGPRLPSEQALFPL